MIRRAEKTDIDRIMEIIRMSKTDMHSYGNFQWDEGYPKKENFLGDMEERTLYVYEEEGRVLGVVCINHEEPEEYEGISWGSDEKALVIHRLGVDYAALGKGIGYQLVEYAKEVSRETGVKYIRTDTNALNTKAQGLLKKCGYTFRGETGLVGHAGRFFCYDKVLEE